MKILRAIFIYLTFLLTAYWSFSAPGFELPDSVKEMTVRYKSVKNLIVIPVLVNNIPVNLILDTGCRSLVLFGKKFEKLLEVNPLSRVQFSGLGSGAPITGKVSLMNTVTIEQILGSDIPIVVVPSRKLFADHREIDGVIGFDIFFKFEIEVNPRYSSITFRPAEDGIMKESFDVVPLEVVETRPVLKSHVSLHDKEPAAYDLMIDTGSAFGLLVKTPFTDDAFFQRTIGYGFNGEVNGYKTISSHVDLSGHVLHDVPVGVIINRDNHYASIGMEILKDYVFVINYFKRYVALKRWRT